MITVLTDRVAELNLEIYQGEDYQLPLLFQQANGQPLDLTGSTAIARIYRHVAPVTSFTIDNSQPTAGQLIVSLTQTTIEQYLPPASYSWMLFLVNAQALSEPKIRGSIAVYGYG